MSYKKLVGRFGEEEFNLYRWCEAGPKSLRTSVIKIGGSHGNLRDLRRAWDKLAHLFLLFPTLN